MIFRLVMSAEFVAITAALAMPESLQSLGLASFILATAALVVAIFPSPASGVAKVLRPAAVVVLAAPALWMALQAVPMPMDTLGNPIWATASAALGKPLTETITVDKGATMLSLAQYGAVLAAALVTGVITLDRYRAAQVLHILLSIATIATAIWFGKKTDGIGGADGSTVAVLGVLFSCATAIRAADQIARHSRPGTIAPAPLLVLSTATIAMIVCLAALLVRTNSTAVIAALLGSGILLSVFAIRRWFLGLWGTAGVFATAAIIFVASATVIPFRTNTDVTIALSTSSQIATERMLQDVRPAGSGAGASTVLLPLYRDMGIGAPRERPTAAAAMVIDMGSAFLCGVVAIAMLAACILIRRSLSRAYDYVYPALGAGASIALTILAFADHGILSLGASLLVAALFGLAFGQSVSGAGREAMSLESKEASDRMAGPVPASRPRLAPAFLTLWPRVALAVLGIALIIPTIWMILPGWYLGGQSSLAAAISAAAGWPNEISKPVSVAAAHEDFWIRGESRSGKDPALAADEQKTELPAASNAFARALRSSPLRGDIWLMLAAASKQNSIQTAAMLKMSYYTAPNDLDLLPLRLSVALATDAVVRELEFRDLIKRDVSLVVTRRPAIRPALVAAYRSASAEGKIYLENLISELDPTYLDNMRARNSRQGSR
ncbi:hypothetical protein [Bradyrhizobium sp. 199]|uniref:hypothetical protein n=1 Tax=Bradyrhizobium sp. 199 TaxID=2782664 RepID=UPI001FFA44C2|nr:hypothetical protein [Bradyrhizobium sp. 199]MCK1359462.1 hypothetical protein [Bradyrhizobium sp. 199]